MLREAFLQGEIDAPGDVPVVVFATFAVEL
jgi:hypothetical protein